MSVLLSPLQIKDVVFRNRIVVSPMCQYSSQDGFAGDWHLVHLGSRAVGGAGLVIQEASAVSPEGRITPADLGIYKDEHLERLRRINTFIEDQGAVPGIQIAHAGRKASCAKPSDGGHQLSEKEGGWLTVAPSPVPFRSEDALPLALDKGGIEKAIGDFKKAAERSLRAGYKVLEIHAAHGYLIHEFLSPISNHRTDQYGGSFENRIRFLVEITEAVQEVWPKELPLFVRISASDWVEDGWDIDEAVKLAGVLKTNGVDLVDCSSAGMVPHAKIDVKPGYQVPFSDRIKNETGILTGAVGLITDAKQAEEILKTKQADLILMARELLRNPYFPLEAANTLGADMEWPVQYQRAKR